MPGSNRSLSSQSKHDRKVLQIVMEYKKKGYEMEADIPGYPKPRTISSYRPDVIARKGGYETIIEVETLDSIGSARDIAQQSAFRHEAMRDPKLHFRRVVAE